MCILFIHHLAPALKDISEQQTYTDADVSRCLYACSSALTAVPAPTTCGHSGAQGMLYADPEAQHSQMTPSTTITPLSPSSPWWCEHTAPLAVTADAVSCMSWTLHSAADLV